MVCERFSVVANRYFNRKSRLLADPYGSTIKCNAIVFYYKSRRLWDPYGSTIKCNSVLSYDQHLLFTIAPALHPQPAYQASPWSYKYFHVSNVKTNFQMLPIALLLHVFIRFDQLKYGARCAPRNYTQMHTLHIFIQVWKQTTINI